MEDRFKFRIWCNGWGCLIYPTQIDFEHGVAEYIGADGEYNEVDIKGCHIEQCTGLKDKNGKLIFEGDILKSSSRLGRVYWGKNGEWRFSDKTTFSSNPLCLYLFENFEMLEIIGNIHENPELLEA